MSKDEKFKSEFVDHLKSIIPEEVRKLNLIFPEIQTGEIRFNELGIHSVYLFSVSDSDNNSIIIKFKRRDFHYVKPDYIFDSIYYCSDGCNEYRFNENLELTAKYLLDVSILPRLNREEKLHILDVINEWLLMEKKLENTNNYIPVYQIEKNGRAVKNPYIILKEKLKNEEKYKELDEIVENLNMNKNIHMRKCKIKDGVVKKEKETYIIIGFEDYFKK